MSTSVLARLPENGEPDLLFLLFHGVGANADGMAPLAMRLAQEYPQAAVLCIDAPDDFDAAPGGSGRQWFSIRGIDEENRPARVGRNPRTGTRVSVTEKYVPFFKTGKEMRERLNKSD